MAGRLFGNRRVPFVVQAAQFDLVELAHQPMPVRLVCLVEKRDDGGIVTAPSSGTP